MNGIKKVFAVYLAAAVAVSAVALPSAWKAFEAKYNIAAGSHLATAKCTTCHTNMKGKILNAYGKDIDVLLKKESRKKVNAADLTAVESLDSSKTGKTNLQRIKADQLPGG